MGDANKSDEKKATAKKSEGGDVEARLARLEKIVKEHDSRIKNAGH